MTTPFYKTYEDENAGIFKRAYEADEENKTSIIDPYIGAEVLFPIDGTQKLDRVLNRKITDNDEPEGKYNKNTTLDTHIHEV